MGGRWEHGSTFGWPWADLIPPGPDDKPAAPPWGRSSLLFGSGRQALAALVEHGVRSRRWRRLWVPTYFCGPVLESLAGVIELATYPDRPGRPAPDLTTLGLAAGDAVLVVNHFGLRSAPDLTRVFRTGIDIVEDHTHDPWSPWAFASEADFCFASLRKTLPLPDGASLWSPLLHQLPPPPVPTAAHDRAAAAAVEGALLKDLALRGHAVGPVDYRPLVIQAEEAIAAAPPSAMTQLSQTLLPLAPVAEWRAARQANFQVLAAELEGVGGLEVLRPTAPGAVPFMVTVRFSSAAERDRCRAELIESNVYPAVLWPMERPGLPTEDLVLSRHILSFHCDMRYGPDDMRRVADLAAVPAR